MRTLRLTLSVLFLLISLASRASHFSGYDMNLTHLGNDTYKVKLTIFKDAITSSNPLPQFVDFATYISVTNVNANFNFQMPKISSYYATYNPADCPPFYANLSLQVGVYEYTITSTQAQALNNSNGYYFSAYTCCRNEGVNNVLNSSSTGINFTMDLPRLNAGSPTRYNNSPRFTRTPLAFYCVGKPYTVQLNCTDPDGDSLVYSLIPPTDGISAVKPFGTVTYAPGYNLNYNILDGVPDINLNPTTGVFSFIPIKIGRYLVGFKCDEYRKINNVATKIGTVYREFQLETVLCPESPPVVSDNRNRKNVIVDTLEIGKEYSITFTGRDVPIDSVYMYILPDIQDNILNPNLYDSKWGEVGFLQTGTIAQNLVIAGMGIVQGQFKWTPNCYAAKPQGHKFKIVVRDQTCPTPFYDTTYVTLYVTKTSNNSPYMIINNDTLKNNSTRNYYIVEGEKFQLDADSLLKTYDRDTLNSVILSMVADPSNGIVNSKYYLKLNSDSLFGTAAFAWQTECNDERTQPYRFRFKAQDSDCVQADTISLLINIYVKSKVAAFPIQGTTSVTDTSLTYAYYTYSNQNGNYFWYGDSVEVLSGQGDSLVVVKWKSLKENKLYCVFSNSQTICTDTSFITINKTTGLNTAYHSNIKIYPNPSNKIIYLEGLAVNENTLVEIFDLQGKLILANRIEETGKIDISAIEKGVYILKIRDLVQRIVKM